MMDVSVKSIKNAKRSRILQPEEHETFQTLCECLRHKYVNMVATLATPPIQPAISLPN